MKSNRLIRAKELGIDLSKHVMYSETIEKVVKTYLKEKVGPEKVEDTFKSIEEQYAQYLKELPYIGGKKSIHNGEGGTYDCIFLFALYEALNHKPTMQDIYDLNCSVFLPSFEKLKKWKFIDANHALILRIIHFFLEWQHGWVERIEKPKQDSLCVWNPLLKRKASIIDLIVVRLPNLPKPIIFCI